MKILYFDIFSGISGDMTLGALLDVGVDFDFLKNQIATLDFNGYDLSFDKKDINGISAGDFDVLIHKHEHVHRHLSHIEQIIDNSSISENAKSISKTIFRHLAFAEAKVHGKSLEEIHFHEVGAIDSIVDIVGTAVCIDKLEVDKIYFGALPTFAGQTKCAHGIIPLPAPAVAELTKGLVYSGEPVDGELVTPTGASILTSVGEQIFGMPMGFKILNVGYGAGKKKFNRPNYLRVFLGEIDECYETSKEVFSNEEKDVLQIEFNIDDMNPELYDNLMDEVFNAGALDVYMTNILMKKSRIGVLVTVIAPTCLLDQISDVIFKNSTTIGIRYQEKKRKCLKREIQKMETEYGVVHVKNTILDGNIINSKLEYEDCKRLAKEYNIPIKQIYNDIKPRG